MENSEQIHEIKRLIVDQGRDWAEFKRKHESTVATVGELKAEFDGLVKAMNRQGTVTRPSAGPAPETWIDAKSKRPVAVLAPEHKLADLESKATGTPSIGRVLRGLVLGGKADDARELEDERKALSIGADPAGGYTVSGLLASSWIDLLRAQMALTRAGAMTFPMDAGVVSIAKLLSDPTCSWHGENAALTDSDASFGQVSLRAKTVTCLVKLSVELAQDSANIEQILQRSITAAMSKAIDDAGLNGVAVNAAAAPAGILDLAGRNTVTGIGAPSSWDFLIDGGYELMADNVPEASIGALVAHPLLWKVMSKAKTGITNDKTPLPMPEFAARLPKIWTTAAPTDTAIIADWRDLVFGVRQQISVRVLDQAFMGSNLQLALLAYARVDFAAVRPQSFCTLEGLTLS